MLELDHSFPEWMRSHHQVSEMRLFSKTCLSTLERNEFSMRKIPECTSSPGHDHYIGRSVLALNVNWNLLFLVHLFMTGNCAVNTQLFSKLCLCVFPLQLATLSEPWLWRHSQSLKLSSTLMIWFGYFPDMIVLQLVAARGSGILPRKLHILRKNCSLLGYYVASSVKSLPAFRDNLTVST